MHPTEPSAHGLYRDCGIMTLRSSIFCLYSILLACVLAFYFLLSCFCPLWVLFSPVVCVLVSLQLCFVCRCFSWEERGGAWLDLAILCRCCTVLWCAYLCIFYGLCDTVGVFAAIFVGATWLLPTPLLGYCLIFLLMCQVLGRRFCILAV